MNHHRQKTWNRHISCGKDEDLISLATFSAEVNVFDTL
jgi:hypothetical protein